MSELTKALVKARIACNAVVHKAGKNQAQGFAYVGHEHVLVSGAREALLVNGLALVETGVTFLGELKYTTRNGEQTCWNWRGTFLLMHESGESKVFEFSATTGPNDKAAFVASTALDRTALLRICHLAGGAKEDPEHDSNERFEDAARRPRQVASVAEKLDRIAAQGGERAVERPTAPAGRAASPSSSDEERAHGAGRGSTAERGGDPARAGDVASAVVSGMAQTAQAAETSGERGNLPKANASDAGFQVGSLADSATAAPIVQSPALDARSGELLDAKAWMARNNTLAQAAYEISGIRLGEMDADGLHVPTVPCPKFSDKARKFAGMSYSDPKCAGYLREVVIPDKGFAEKSIAIQLWATYAVARHEMNKELGTVADAEGANV